MPSTQPVEILMVDDDPLDIELFERTIRRQRIVNPVHSAHDGIDALAYLRARSSCNAAPLVVLLDINMPRMNGIECLRAIRDDDSLRSTIVFVLTSSDNDRDVFDAYNLNVAGYLVKSDLGTGFREGIRLLRSYLQVSDPPAPTS